ncbi:MAG: hypothetical protein M8865_13060 [marine benthic group bacterium]|nr:hypothetical protein [Gemmatimonadota bacterium]
MSHEAAGQGVFKSSLWVTRLMARLGLSSDPGQASLWTTLLVVGIISLPPLILSALGGTAWGSAVEIPFLHDANSLVRLFVVVPVLVVAANAVGVQLGVAMSYLDSSSLIGEADRPEYTDARADIGRRASSTTTELVILALALLVPLLLLLLVKAEPRSGLTNWMLDPTDDIALSPAGWYFTLISRPLVGFFLVLWAWRYLVWCLFMRRLGGMDLELQPAHPDLVGGIAPVVRAHTSFVLVGLAVNAALSGAIANELLYGGVSMTEVRPEIVFFTVISVIALAAPLIAFTPGLIRAKNRGLIEYGRLGHDLTVDFDARWKTPGNEKLLDTADPSAMADFNADYDTVRGMKVFPLGLRALVVLAVILFVPFGALALTQVSLTQLLRAMASKAF